MAKKKTRDRAESAGAVPHEFVPVSGVTQADAAAAGSIVHPSFDNSRLTLGGYVVINLAFDVFCILNLILVNIVLKEPRGLYYFFGLLMVSLLVVSIFDYFYDRKIDPALDSQSRA